MIQPVGSVYVIIEDPAPTPVTKPVNGTIVATDGLLLEYKARPPPTASARYVVAFTHIGDALPVIGNGSGLTVNGAVMIQPVAVIV
jgi:hypothetical protein